MSNSAHKPTVVFLMGPTATGKTDLGIALAQALDTEIISVDSTLVYRGMDIGAAKPTLAERQNIPHQLIDVRDPKDTYSAANFLQDAGAHVEALHARNKVPLLVGGTMLYFKVLLEGLAKMPAADAEIRAAIKAAASEQGWPALHEKLMQVDPETAGRLHPNHSQRIARALEVFEITGKPLSEWHKAGAASSFADKYRIVQIALTVKDRNLLHNRIQMRFQKMLEMGFEEEVRTLFQRGDLNPQLPALRAVGYRQMWEFLEGKIELSQAVEKGIIATRQLAKRQMTWLRSWPQVLTLECDGVLTSAGVAQQRKFTEIRDRALNSVDPTTI